MPSSAQQPQRVILLPYVGQESRKSTCQSKARKVKLNPGWHTGNGTQNNEHAMKDEGAAGRTARSPSVGWMQLAWVLLLSFAVFHLDAAAYYAVLWCHGVQGGMEGLMRSLGSGWWLATMLPWAVLIFALRAMTGHPRARLVWALAPSAAASLVGLLWLATTAPNPRPRFEQWMKTKMPAEVTGLRCVLHGFGMAGGFDYYSFTCSREETERLIREMKMTKCEFLSREERDDYLPRRRGIEDCRGWPGVEMYRSRDGKAKAWSYDLATDETHTKVIVVAGRI